MIPEAELLDGLENAANIMMSKLPSFTGYDRDELMNMGWLVVQSRNTSNCNPKYLVSDCYQWIIQGLTRENHTDNKHYREDLSRLNNFLPSDYDRVSPEKVGEHAENIEELAYILGKCPLNEQEQEIIRRRVLDDQTVQRIADEMGLGRRHMAQNKYVSIIKRLKQASN